MLKGAPDAAEQSAAAAALGVLLPASAAAPRCEVWAGNWPAVSIFADVATQWLMGPGGPVALDYRALPQRCRPGQGGRSGRRLFEALQVMEAEALLWMRERAK